MDELTLGDGQSLFADDQAKVLAVCTGKLGVVAEPDPIQLADPA